ncbi:hypothetical protein GJAV_G00222130 [Gymnothorax javanicus]|nr:hypothetical protein GJAV_G00222130 [Gymnothorax javanicus]
MPLGAKVLEAEVTSINLPEEAPQWVFCVAGEYGVYELYRIILAVAKNTRVLVSSDRRERETRIARQVDARHYRGCQTGANRLRTDEKKTKTRCGASSQQRALSLIRFHGRAVLSPVLSEEQRREMAWYRQRAAQLDAGRRSLHTERALTQVQLILDGAQVHQVSEGEKQFQTPPTALSAKVELPNGFVLSPGVKEGKVLIRVPLMGAHPKRR